MTTWAPVPGWVGYYEASDAGEVRSVSRREYPHSKVGRYVRFSEDDVAQIRQLIRVEAKDAADASNPYDFKGKAS